MNLRNKLQQSEQKLEPLEKKVYAPWAFTDREREKSAINREIYNEIKDKAKKIAYTTGYAHQVAYMIIVDREYFKDLIENEDTQRKSELIRELALIADSGNLCFGYGYQGKLSYYKDYQGNEYSEVFSIKINTD